MSEFYNIVLLYDLHLNQFAIKIFSIVNKEKSLNFQNIYINDDYSGGQVYFPERNYEFKPKANSLVMWAGNKNFIHGVKDPIDGNRYNVYRSIKFKDFDKYTI
jgi:hypothetical protein